MAQMNLAGFLRNEGRIPSTGSEWADMAVVPRLQDWSGGHGRMIDPAMLPQQSPQSLGMFNQPTFADTGFADFLRNQYLPQMGR